jgi:hypothetical protein
LILILLALVTFFPIILPAILIFRFHITLLMFICARRFLLPIFRRKQTGALKLI